MWCVLSVWDVPVCVGVGVKMGGCECVCVSGYECVCESVWLFGGGGRAF